MCLSPSPISLIFHQYHNAHRNFHTKKTTNIQKPYLTRSTCKYGMKHRNARLYTPRQTRLIWVTLNQLLAQLIKIPREWFFLKSYLRFYSQSILSIDLWPSNKTWEKWIHNVRGYVCWCLVQEIPLDQMLIGCNQERSRHSLQGLR